MKRDLITLLVALSLSRPARADEPTAADVEGAPRPGEESGRVDLVVHEEGTLRKVGRGILVAPRALVEALATPIRVGLWTYGRYNLKERYYQTFFNESRTTGIYPTATFESGFGLNVGAKLVHTGMVRPQDGGELYATIGGAYRGQVGATIRTSDAARDRYQLELGVMWERRPRDRFFGIGDGGDDFMPEVRYRKRTTRVIGVADVRAFDHIFVRGSGALGDVDYSRADEGFPIDIVYRDEITGFDTGVQQLYGELELRYDTRRAGSVWDPSAVPATGWLLAGFGGRVLGFDESASFWRYGMDLQRFFRIMRGPRAISARLYGEAVSGSLDEVPFSQLPTLGGAELLRGYETDRFHDRVALVGSLAYTWDLSAVLDASLFVDVGRVYRRLEDIELEGLRLGYGIEVQAHTRDTFVARANLASTKDGGIFVGLAFQPVYDPTVRVRRR